LVHKILQAVGIT